MARKMLKDLAISVVVPVYDGGEEFRRCLSALAEAEPAATEIIVVVDGDTCRSEEIAGTFGVQILHTPVLGGPAQARNLGACAAQGDLLFFVDADVLVPPNVMDQIAAIFWQEPDLAAVFGSYDDVPGASNFLSQYRNLLHHYVHQTSSVEASTFWAGCGVIRRDIFLEMGGFDVGYTRPAIEDIELGYRLKRAGHQIRLCKTLQVKHLKGWTALSLLKADVLDRALPWTELILRDRHFVNDLNLRLSSRVSVMLVYGLLGTLTAVWWWPGSLAVSGAVILALLVLNAPLYRFFRRKRGFRFAVQTIPWHWLYYFYSGLAFAIGVARYLCRKWGPAGASLPTVPERELTEGEQELA